MPRFLQDFPDCVPVVWLPHPSFGTSLEAQSTLAALLGTGRDAARWHCCICWKPRQPCVWAQLCCCLTQMCFVWKWGQMAWIHSFLLHKQKTKPKTGCARRSCTLRPDPGIHTNTAQSYRMLPDGDYGNFKEKKNTNTILWGGGCTFKFAFGRETDLICLKYTTKRGTPQK